MRLQVERGAAHNCAWSQIASLKIVAENLDDGEEDFGRRRSWKRMRSVFVLAFSCKKLAQSHQRQIADLKAKLNSLKIQKRKNPPSRSRPGPAL